MTEPIYKNYFEGHYLALDGNFKVIAHHPSRIRIREMAWTEGVMHPIIVINSRTVPDEEIVQKEKELLQDLAPYL